MFGILIVDNNAIFRGLLKETLVAHFPWAEITEASNAAIALRKIEAAPPDLVFMDVEMRGQSGFGLARTLRSTHPSLAVVFLTSKDLPEYREAANGLDAVAFLSKGSTPIDRIVRLVESLFRGQRVDAGDGDPA